MFNFFSMSGNYEQRKVDNTVIDDLEIDTAMVTDGGHDYETAVKSPLYNDGEWVIVEAYDTKLDAQRGHKKWVRTMRDEPPATLVDCQNSGVSQLCAAFGCDTEFDAND